MGVPDPEIAGEGTGRKGEGLRGGEPGDWTMDGVDGLDAECFIAERRGGSGI